MKAKNAGPERLAKIRKQDLRRRTGKEPDDRIARSEARRSRTMICVGLALAVLMVYWRTFHFGFVAYDDDQFVYQNPVLKSGLSATTVAWAFGLHYANWHPLTWISYLLDVQLFGMNAGAFHVMNVLFHAAATVLLFLALWRMTGRTWRSATVAAVFALHPLHVESVAWVAERKDVLSTFLEMLSLLLYARYAERPSTRRYVLVSLTFALSLMAKPMLVTFPLVLLLLDYWPLRRIPWPPNWPRDRRVVLEKIPLLLLSPAASILTVLAQRDYGTVASLDHVSLASRLGNAAVAYVTYIKESLWPDNLAALYPVTTPAASAALLAVILVLALTAAAVALARRKPYLFTGWFWYLGMLVPVIGIVQVGVQSRADRYMYAPLVGLSIAVVWICADWVESRPQWRQVATIATAAVLLVFAIGSYRQAGYWKDSRTLFEHTLAVTDRNYVMHNNLGVILAGDGDIRGAIEHYRQAVAINPEYADGHENLGNVLLRTDQFEEARSQLQAAIRLKPGMAIAHLDLGVYYIRSGDYPQAIAHMTDSLRLNPSDPQVHSNLCYALQHVGRLDEAIGECREALRLRPDYPDATFNLRNAMAAKH